MAQHENMWGPRLGHLQTTCDSSSQGSDTSGLCANLYLHGHSYRGTQNLKTNIFIIQK